MNTVVYGMDLSRKTLLTLYEPVNQLASHLLKSRKFFNSEQLNMYYIRKYIFAYWRPTFTTRTKIISSVIVRLYGFPNDH